jgi:hypothetical protein
MELLNTVLSWLMKKRMHQIELFMLYPHEVQQEWFRRLIQSARDTEWGVKYDYRSINRPSQFRERVPVSDYDALSPYIDRLRRGEQNLLWPQEIKWFAKSSGTTGDRSKFIPVSEDALEDCHFNGGKDVLTLFCANNTDTRLFTGKGLTLGGSHHINDFDSEMYYGDLSAILMQNLPFWAQFIRTPELSIALMDEWEEKIEMMARVTSAENVTNISGVPSWTLLLLRKVLEVSGKRSISEVWPNLELYCHGGVSFTPYRKQFREIIGSESVHFMETYNASEGFFGIQDRPNADDMLLMLDYGIYYEFIPMEFFGSDHPMALGLEEVETGKNYAMLISTNAGLWRYLIGDTVRFTSTNPYRIQITGRTKNFINAFGEELMIDNAEKALESACRKTGAQISDYTAAPVYFAENLSGAHQWLIEFDKMPSSLEYFTEIFDNALKALNSDYEAKRYHNMILQPPLITPLEKGTFYLWLKSRNKLGGQNKVPRLSNDRIWVDEILSLTGSQEILIQ